MSEIERSQFDESKNDLPSILERRETKPVAEVSKSSSPALAWVGVVMGIVVSVFIGWKFISPKFDSSSVDDIPLIKKSASPVKVRPSDPGGIDVPNRDRSIYARIDSGNDEPVVEKLLPTPEQPIELPVPEDEDIAKDEAFVAQETEDKSKLDDYSIIQPNKPVEVVENNTPEVKPVVEKTEPPKVLPEPKVELKPEQKIEEKVEPKVEPKEEPKAEVKPEVKTTSGIWKVQLVSLKEKELVDKAWTDIKAKLPEIVSGLPHVIETADLGAKGVYYRLKVGGFESREQADALCSKFKDKKQGCFVAK